MSGGSYMFLMMLRTIFAIIVVMVASADSANANQLRAFHTADGNIGCEIFTGNGTNGGGARCDIANRGWRAPQRPASCHLDYGNGLIVTSRGAAEFTCAGDTILHQGFALLPGGSVEVGPYKCTGLVAAIRCVNRDTRHGFKISRAVAKRF